jgi:hypothetical protein
VLLLQVKSTSLALIMQRPESGSCRVCNFIMYLFNFDFVHCLQVGNVLYFAWVLKARLSPRLAQQAPVSNRCVSLSEK